jgi:hypothetical protein
MSLDTPLPVPPEIAKEQLARCRQVDDFCPVFFEWYKYVGILCNFCASIRPDSPAVRKLPVLHYAVLVGLLNRCSRLMLANVALSHDGLFGETTSILDRCIFESAIKITWLSKQRNEECFRRFIADGLKTEVEFKTLIGQIISERTGKQFEIESRMLESINNYIASSGLSEEEIIQSKKLPDFASMIKSIGGNRLLYIAGQKIGSHHIHGTWPSLRFHYLDEDDGFLIPRDHDCRTHVNQYAYISFFLIHAMRAFIEHICSEQKDVEVFVDLFNSIENEIRNLYSEVVGNDFDEANQT